MAHLGEAQGVIELFKLKKTSSQLFEGEGLHCLITGEGPFEAAASVAHHLGLKKYTSVINLGIAGSFDAETKIGEIYPVRSLYLVIENKPQFKSFKSLESGLDCITSFERILHVEKASALSGVGSLVDREAWGVAFACKNVGLPFSSYKLISDFAGTLGACEIVKDKADEWSQKIALHLQTLLHVKSELKSLIELPGFHLTFSTRHQFEEMVKKIGLREGLSTEEVLKTLPLKKIKDEISLPKERSRKLLSSMEGRLDPLKEKLEKGLHEFKSPLEKKGITITHDATWETSELKISFSVANQTELDEKMSGIEKIDFALFANLRNGVFHVE